MRQRRNLTPTLALNPLPNLTLPLVARAADQIEDGESLYERARFSGAAHHGACPRGSSTDGQKNQANPVESPRALSGLSRGTMIERGSNHRPTGINPVVTILRFLLSGCQSAFHGDKPRGDEPRLEIAHGHVEYIAAAPPRFDPAVCSRGKMEVHLSMSGRVYHLHKRCSALRAPGNSPSLGRLFSAGSAMSGGSSACSACSW